MAYPDIEILLATYNGARFLEAQIDSLLLQRDVSFRILIRDDGSTDDTLRIVDRYRSAIPETIDLLSSSGNVGAKKNFEILLERSTAPYVALCDQDDVWMPRKLQVLLGILREMEARYGSQTPLLAYSDLLVVDEDLRERHPSYWSYSGCDPEHTNLARLLVRNPVAGCASLVNRALVRASLPIPDEALVHDYWLTLVASTAGKIAAVREALVSYRQHRGNVIGARAYNWRTTARRVMSGRSDWDIGARRRQAAALLERCESTLAAADRTLLEDFISLPERHWIARRWLLLHHGILLPGVLRNLALLFWVRLGR